MFPVLDFDPVPEPAAPTSSLAMFAVSCLNRTLFEPGSEFSETRMRKTNLARLLARRVDGIHPTGRDWPGLVSA